MELDKPEQSDAGLGEIFQRIVGSRSSTTVARSA